MVLKKGVMLLAKEPPAGLLRKIRDVLQGACKEHRRIGRGDGLYLILRKGNCETIPTFL